MAAKAILYTFHGNLYVLKIQHSNWLNFATAYHYKQTKKSYPPSLVASFTGFAAARLSVANSKISFHTSMTILQQNKIVTSHDDRTQRPVCNTANKPNSLDEQRADVSLFQ